MSKIKRRTFLKHSAIAGLTPLVGAKLFSASENSTKPAISVVEGADYYKNTLKAVEQLGGIGKFVSKGSKVAILANPQRNNPGAFTSPKVVDAVIKLCKQAEAKEINLISWSTEKNWRATGLMKVAEDNQINLKITNLKDESLFKPVPVPKGKSLKEARIMKTFFENDVFINVPVTKDHAGNKFTGTLKNLMGINSPMNNRTFHKPGWKTDLNSITHLDQCIADLNTIIKPDLCIVDATEFIITNGPFGPGKIHKPQKVVAGTDRVGIDAYCATLWGLNPTDIIMLRKSYEHKLGEIDLKKIEIKEIKI